MPCTFRPRGGLPVHRPRTSTRTHDERNRAMAGIGAFPKVEQGGGRAGGPPGLHPIQQPVLRPAAGSLGSDVTAQAVRHIGPEYGRSTPGPPGPCRPAAPACSAPRCQPYTCTRSHPVGIGLEHE